MLQLASRLNEITVSAASAISAQGQALAKQGIEVISLAVGEPDFDTPEHVVEAACAAARGGDTHYPPLDGTPALKAAVRQKFACENGLDVAPDQIMIGNGAKQLILNAMMATLNPGDEVIIPTPCYISYLDIVRLAAGRPVLLTCHQADGFLPQLNAIESLIGPRTRWLILNSPNNPTGAVYGAEVLAGIADVLRRHPQVWVLLDDIYEHLIYPSGNREARTFVTLAAIAPDLRDRLLTINGCSKSHAMTGWRVGYCAGPAPLIKGMMRVQGQTTSGVCTISQAAARAALDGSQTLLDERRAIYRERRDLMVTRLTRIPLLQCHRPDGAFYVFPDISACFGLTTASGRIIRDGEGFVQTLLAEHHVATVPGSAFGLATHLRLSYATRTDLITEACQRLEVFCAGLHRA